jgi:glycosyltransferase involved in cell wall biosynthesis
MNGARILFIADDCPWPVNSGFRHRMSHQIRALAEVGEIDLFAAVHEGTVVAPPPLDVGVRRWTSVEVPTVNLGPAVLARTIVDRLPRRIQWRHWELAKVALSSWSDGPYDLVWYGHADVYPPLSGLQPSAATFVDLDNLEDQTLRARRRSKAASLTAEGLARRARRAVVRGLDRVDETRWRQLQERIASVADGVGLCSELDRRRLGGARTFVIPNGYEPDGSPVTAPPKSHAIVMVGQFVYPPNREAAAFFAEAVLPLIRRVDPSVELRLVGRHAGTLDGLLGREGVVVTGQVDDAAAELRRARVAVAPLRAGSGTRIKVLEAFALGVPVVATSVGCEGIEAEPGRDLLVADDPKGLADACLRVLVEDALWLDLSAAGRVVYESRYRWADIRPLITQIARELLEGVGGELKHR